MRRYILLIFLVLALLCPRLARAIEPGLTNTTEVDTSPNCWIYKLILPNGSLTCNADNSATLSITAAETDPIVKAIVGIVKSDGSIISAATSGTDYLSPTTPEVIVSKSTNYTLGTDAAKENYNGLVLITAVATLTLPSAVVGMNACVIATGAFSVSVDVNGSDHWILNGTALTAGNKVTSSGVTGDTLCWVCGTANTWYILPGANVNWIDGG
jgi:hypothetical protein